MKPSDSHKRALNYIYQKALYPEVEVRRAKAGSIYGEGPQTPQPKPATKPKLIRRQGTLL